MGKRKTAAMVLAVCMLISVFMPQTTVWAVGTKQGEEQVVIDVTEYGADPSGERDSMPGIKAALEAAKKVSGPVTLDFPQGEYQIYPDQAYQRELYVSNTVGTNQSYKMKTIGFLFEDMQDVTVEGNGSLFMFHGKMTTFAAINSTNIRFQNYDFDFYTPSVVDLTVESVSGNKAVIYVPECYDYQISGTSITWKCDASPYTGQPYWTASNALANAANQKCDLSTGLTVRSTTDLFNNLSSITDKGNNRLEFTYRSNVSFKENVCYQMRDTTRDHPGMFFWKSKDITMENIGVHFLYGFGIVAQSMENLTLRNVNFGAREGTGRTTAGFADFLQISGCKGEVLIEGCSFANAHDDPINVHGTFNQVAQRISSRKFKVSYMHHETAGFPNFFIGDEVEFINRSNMKAVSGAAAKVVDVKGPTGCGGASESGSGSLTDTIITLDKDIPAEVTAGGYVVENITYTPSVTIRNNVFKETSTRGILVTTRKKVLIEDNVFDGTNMSAISISSDADDWYESGRVEDVTIAGNTFYRVNNTSTAYNNVNTQPAVINIVPTNTSLTDTVHRNIKIEDNDFYILDGAVVQGKSVSNLQITDNRIYRYEPNVTVSLNSTASSMKTGETVNLSGNVTGSTYSRELYYLMGCKNVTIAGNQYDDGLKPAAVLNSTSAGEVHLGEGENISLNGPGSVSAKQGTVSYESSDREILKVTAGGKLTALKAGKAKIRAYRAAAGRKFVSGWKEITVTAGSASGNLPTAVTLSGGKETSSVIGEKIQYTAQTVPAGTGAAVTWSVVDAATQNTTSCATINQSGTLTTVSNGVVEVIASTANGLDARKLLVIHKGSKVKSSNLEIENRDDANWSITGDGIQINAQPQGLYKEQTAKNVFLYQPKGDMTKVEATVKLHGKTVKGWQEAGLVFYQSEDDYFSIERKHSGYGESGGSSSPKIKITVEDDRLSDDSKVYEGDGVDDPGTTDIWLKLVKNGNTLSGLEAYYKTSESGAWIKRAIPMSSGKISGKPDLSMPLTNSFRIGFITGVNDSVSERTPFVFSDFKVKIGDGAEQTIDLAYDNTPPSASGVRTVYNEETKELGAEYTFSDANSSQGDAKGTELIRYMASDTQNGVYTLAADLDTLAGKWVKAVVIPKDSNGLYGAPAVSQTGIKIAGVVSGDGASLPASESALKSADIRGVSGFAAFSGSVKEYRTKASKSESSLTASFAAKDEKASVEVFLNNKKCFPAEGAQQSSKAENLALRLVSGANVILVKVTAEDQKSCSEYRWSVLREGGSEAVLTGVKLNGQALSGFAADRYEYAYTAQKNVSRLQIAAETSAASANALADVWVNGRMTEGREVEAKLVPGINHIVIRIRPETMAFQKVYKIEVTAEIERNAKLLNADFRAPEITLSPEFDSDIFTYAGVSTAAKTTLSLEAEEEDAAIELVLNKTSLRTGIGALEETIPLALGDNEILVKVVSEDHAAEKTYRFQIEGAYEIPAKKYRITYQADMEAAGKLTAKTDSQETTEGSVLVEENSSVTLTAEVNPGYEFLGWYNEEDERISQELSLVLPAITKDAAYTAKFKAAVTDKDLEDAVNAAENKDLSGYDEGKVQEYQKALNAVRELIGTNADPLQIQKALEALAKAEKELTPAEPDTEENPDEGSQDEPKDEPKGDPEGEAGKIGLNFVFEEDGYTYRVTGLNGKRGTVTVTAVKKEKKVVVLPEVKKSGYTFKVTEIGAGAYQGNKKTLKSVTIGINVTKIGKKAFFKCSNLKTFRFMGTTAPQIEKKALKGIHKNCKMQYPKKMKKKQLNKLKKSVKKGGAGSKVSYKKK